MGPPSLLELAIGALGSLLACGPPDRLLSGLAEVPEAEQHVLAIWEAYQRSLRNVLVTARALQPSSPPPPGRAAALQHAVLQAFATFWRPQLLRLSYGVGPMPPGFASLSLVAGQLRHLELAAPGLRSLDAVAAACPQLRCLSLRGCAQLADASLAALARCTALAALDLGGLAALTDGAAFHVSRLPSLAALNLGGTAVTDRALELLCYGHKVRAWQRAAGAAALPPEAAAWPAPPLVHLQLAGTAVGAGGLAELEHLPQLRWGGLGRCCVRAGEGNAGVGTACCCAAVKDTLPSP